MLCYRALEIIIWKVMQDGWRCEEDTPVSLSLL